MLAHEPLPGRAHQRDRLGEQDAHRVAEEERLLRDQLGPAYDAYAREVGMLIPFVGRRAA